MFCPNCGAYVSDGSSFCSNCGMSVGNTGMSYADPAQMTTAPMFQQQANTPQPAPSYEITATPGQSQQFTVPQGQPIVINVNNTNTNTNTNNNINVAGGFGGYSVSAKSRIVAFLLCLLFGPLGVHCFYSGRILRGILFLFTGGFFLIGWLWDLIQIVRGRYVDKYGLRIVE